MLRHLKDAIKLVPELNITDDIKLQNATEELSKVVDDIRTADELRPTSEIYDPAKRQSLADTAKRLKGYF